MEIKNYIDGVLVEVVRIEWVAGIARYIRENPPRFVIENRVATAEERATLEASEQAEQQEQADWAAMKAAIVAWSGNLTVDKVRPIIQKLIARIEKKG